MAPQELSGPLTARTSVLLSEPMKEAALVVAERRGVGIGNLLRQGLGSLLRVDAMQIPDDDTMDEPAASPEVEPRCDGCRWWEFEIQGALQSQNRQCDNRRSPRYTDETEPTDTCDEFEARS